MGERMPYVTQGIIQLERRNGTEAYFLISPTKDYGIKHDQRDYGVFVYTPPHQETPIKIDESASDAEKKATRTRLSPQSLDDPQHLNKCLMFEQKTRFKVVGEHFIEVLTEAAFQKTAITITMDDKMNVEALRIQAKP